CHLRLGHQQFSDTVDELRVNKWFVSLDVDHHCIVFQRQDFDHFRQSISTGGMICPGNQCLKSALLDDLPDALVVCSNNHAQRLRLRSLPGRPHHHWFAGNVKQGLVRKAGGRCPGRDYSHKAHDCASGAEGAALVPAVGACVCEEVDALMTLASLSSMTGMP